MKGSYIALAGALLVLAGCEATSVSNVGTVPRQEITFAATARYPGNAQMSDQVKVSAVDDPRARKITLFNVGDNRIPAGTVWVNGAFVRQIMSIPARGSVTIAYDNLLEAGPSTADFTRTGAAVNRVEIQTQGGLFSVMGPARD